MSGNRSNFVGEARGQGRGAGELRVVYTSEHVRETHFKCISRIQILQMVVEVMPLECHNGSLCPPGSASCKGAWFLFLCL